MFRIKRSLGILAAMLILCISCSADAQQDIIDISKMDVGQINYRTTAAQMGNLEKTVNVMGKVYYPLGVDVCFEGVEAKFVEYAVEVGDPVKAGDVLLYYSTDSSEVTLTRMELSLKRAQEDMTEGIRTRQEAITRLRAEIPAEKGSYEKEKKNLELRILEIELEQYRYEQERSIGNQSREIEEMKLRREQNVLLAPVDGVVESLSSREAEDILRQGEPLVRIRQEEIMLIEVDNSSGSFRYHMPVLVSVGMGTQTVVLSGQVVAADDALEESRQGSKAYVQLDPHDEEIKQMRNIRVSAATMRVENVLIVPRDALALDSGKYFVNRLHEGMVQKRYVQTGLSIGSDVWILSGVSEEDALILN